MQLQLLRGVFKSTRAATGRTAADRRPPTETRVCARSVRSRPGGNEARWCGTAGRPAGMRGPSRMSGPKRVALTAEDGGFWTHAGARNQKNNPIPQTERSTGYKHERAEGSDNDTVNAFGV